LKKTLKKTLKKNFEKNFEKYYLFFLHKHNSPNNEMTHFPEEIIDNILSFCPGYIRAELRRKNISVKLQNNIVHIGRKLELQELFKSELTLIEQKYTDNHIGYICKSIHKYHGSVNYNWIIICM
jgi:hypothetical protein